MWMLWRIFRSHVTENLLISWIYYKQMPYHSWLNIHSFIQSLTHFKYHAKSLFQLMFGLLKSLLYVHNTTQHNTFWYSSVIHPYQFFHVEHPRWCNIHNIHQCYQSHTTPTLWLFTVWQLVSTSRIGHHEANYTITWK